jgi:hypothetical protein
METSRGGIEMKRFYDLDLLASIETEKDFDELTREDILGAFKKRIADLERNWDKEAFGVVYESESEEE